ncbi:hypothetical protein AB0I81_36015 [Nonomuraea sp. NPDC050404]|uniref:EF-hand domain-containing protein n=1 Tax=Nonomuraea sp. NPDC050404 TaxID=3155783 RepID=UPI00340B1D6A
MSKDAAFHLTRLRARFALLDTTGDGRLRAEDFDLLAERVLNALGVNRDSTKARALVDGCRTYWQGFASACDGEPANGITFGEYVAAATDVDHFDTYGQPYARALAALTDRDDDGYIEPGDFLACMTAIGFPLARVRQLFATLSPKGLIANADWQAAIKDYYVNASADTPGQLLIRRSV